MFRLFDVDEDDFISLNDLIDFYRMMYIDDYKNLLVDNKIKDPNVYRRPINDNMIQDIAKEMLQNFDGDGDGKLNYEEFRKVFIYFLKIKILFTIL